MGSNSFFNPDLVMAPCFDFFFYRHTGRDGLVWPTALSVFSGWYTPWLCGHTSSGTHNTYLYWCGCRGSTVLDCRGFKCSLSYSRHRGVCVVFQMGRFRHPFSFLYFPGLYFLVVFSSTKVHIKLVLRLNWRPRPLAQLGLSSLVWESLCLATEIFLMFM